MSVNRIEKQNVVLTKIKENMSLTSVIVALIVLSAVWGQLTPHFLTFQNFKNICIYISANGIMAAGLTIVLLEGGLDLAQVSLMALVGMAVGIGYEHGASSGEIILIATLVGISGGVFNGVLISVLGINPFIATLGTQLIFRGLAFIVTDGRYISVKNPMIHYLGFNTFLKLPSMVLIMIAVYIIVWFILKYTAFGRNVYNVGGSRIASHLSGISIRKVDMISYVISGICCGIASLLYIAQGSVALNNAGSGSEMDVITATILGGLSLTGGKGSIINTLFGVVLLAVIANGMSLLSISSYYQMLFKGVILIFAVFMDSVKNSRAQ
jgi:ribose transport system permease protein